MATSLVVKDLIKGVKCLIKKRNEIKIAESAITNTHKQIIEKLGDDAAGFYEPLLGKSLSEHELNNFLGELLVGTTSDKKTNLLARVNGLSDELFVDFASDIKKSNFGSKFFDNPELVESWKAISKHADLRTNTTFLENISGYSDDLLKQLDEDLLNPKWADELKTAFTENPTDVGIWKQLKDDPALSWEISKTNPDWQRWGQREFFKEVTAKGKAFEKFVESNISSLRSKLLNKYPNLDINEYEIFTQVQIKTGVGSEHFVADMVLVKKKTDDFGQVVLDKNNVVVLETKLSSGTNLTTPQGNALTKVQSNSNNFDVRSVSKQNTNGYTITNSDNLKINDFIKVYSDGDGSVISDVVSLK